MGLEIRGAKSMIDANTSIALPACCPLCDNAIMEHDEAGLYFAEGAKCLVHFSCLEEVADDED